MSSEEEDFVAFETALAMFTRSYPNIQRLSPMAVSAAFVRAASIIMSQHGIEKEDFVEVVGDAYDSANLPAASDN